MDAGPISRATAPSDADRAFHAAIGRFTAGLSPTALGEAWYDWAMHLAGSPSKQDELVSLAAGIPGRLARTASRSLSGQGPVRSLAGDPRFDAPDWQALPFALYADAFLATQDWWDRATTGLRGVDPRHRDVVRFGARQWLDMIAPSNFAATNPVVLRRTVEEGGANLRRGWRNQAEDLSHLLTGRVERSEAYRVGETVAVTPGEVVYRNRLIELIRYRPTTGTVHDEPLLIVPAWIMKYYILDLSPGNSMVRFLVDRGFEVFIISWKNPGAEDADLGLQDYVDLGVHAALDEIVRRVPGRKVHAAGYCLGGTLLAMAGAAMARDGSDRLATATLLAAQVDFSEPGEIGLFINESQVAFLEDIMAEQGYLRADQMSGAFRMLRSGDLIWSRVVRHYLLGERTETNDLMAWNADSTRMPARMHSEYLRQLFLGNALARGRFDLHGRPVSLDALDLPLFVVATEADHVSPWKSVWKIGRLTLGAMRFVLTKGGHNAGILSEPGHPRRHYRVGDVVQTQADPQAWFAATAPTEGSWWPEWADWLAARSGPPRPPSKGKSLGPAPGTYVFG